MNAVTAPLTIRYKGRTVTAATLADLSREFLTFADAYIGRRWFAFAQVWNPEGECVARIERDGTVLSWDGETVLYAPERPLPEGVIEGTFAILTESPPCALLAGAAR